MFFSLPYIPMHRDDEVWCWIISIFGRTPMKEKTKTQLIEEIQTLKKQIDTLNKVKEEFEKTKESFEFVSSITEQIKDAVIITNLDGKIIYVNKATEEMYGYTRDELMGKDPGILNAEPIADEIQKDIFRTVASGNVWKGSHLNKRKNSTTFTCEFEISPLLNQKGETIAYISVQRDITKQKQLEDEIRESYEKYKSLVECSPDIIYYLDELGNVIDANEKAVQVIGISKEQGLGRHFSEYITPESVPKAMEIFQKIRKVSSLKTEMELLTKHGKRIPVEINTTARYDKQGNFIGTQGIIRDISQHKQTIKKLRKSEEQLRSFVENSTIGIWCFEAEKPIDINLPEDEIIKEFFKTRCVECNDAYAKMLDTTREEIIGIKLPDVMPETEENKEYLRAFIRNGFKLTGGVSHEISKKGEERYFLNSFVATIRDDKLIRAWGTQTDITEQKLTEKALKESEQRFQDVVRNIGAWIWETNADGKYTYASPLCERILGYSPEEIIWKKYFYDFFHPDDREQLKAKAFAVFARKKPFVRFVNRNIRKDGNVIILETSGTPIISDDGQLLGYRGVDRDITERKRTEQIQSVVYKIADAVNRTADLNDLFQYIHKQLSTIIDTTNFYIALYDEDKETLSFPYFVDEKDVSPGRIKLGKGLTEYVLRTGEPLFAPEDVFNELLKKGEVELVGAPSPIWLGAPLKVENKIIGIVVVQSYTNPSLYSKKDLELLQFVSDEIAIAIEHKRSDEALEQSEERYRNLIEISSNGVVLHQDGYVVFANKAARELAGVEKPDDLIGKPVIEFVHPDYRKVVAERINAMLSQKTGVPLIEEKFIKADGTSFDVEVVAVNTSFNGKPAVQVEFRDITERKQTEQLKSVVYKIADAVNRTADTDELFKYIHKELGIVIDTTNFFIALYDKENNTISFPYIVDEKNNFSTSVPLGKTLISYVLRTGKPLLATQEVKNELIQKGEVEPIGTPSKVWLGVPLKIEQETIGVMTVQSYTDPLCYTEKDVEILNYVSNQIAIAITRKRAEEKLQQEKEQLSVTLRSIGDGVITTDKKGNITMMNRVAEKLTGWKSAEAIGRPLKEVFHIINEETRQEVENPVDRVLEEGRIIGLANHTVLISRDGTERILADSGSPLRDRESKIIGVVLIFRDITDKRKMEREMIKIERLESIGVLAGGIAHDFNNILTGILGNLSLAKFYLSPDDKVYKILDSAERASMNAKNLTQQLLTFARGGKPIKKIASIKNLLEETVSFALTGSNISYEIDCADGLSDVKMDAGQISQVINNLVINARQSMPTGGIIKVTARNVIIDKDNYIANLPPGKYAVISIKDKGTGIPKKMLRNIFEPYFTTKQQGSGLGLSICYSIIRNHNGYITVDSELGIGSTFTIYLPATEEKAPILVKEQEIVKGTGRILVMDDEEFVRDICGKMLEIAGYEVEFAQTGEEAIDKYKRAKERGEPFKAVILDLTIPAGMSGKEAIKELREYDSEVKAIVSSGYSNDPIMSNPKKYGFKGVVTKPFRMDELTRILKEVLGRPSASPDVSG